MAKAVPPDSNTVELDCASVSELALPVPSPDPAPKHLPGLPLWDDEEQSHEPSQTDSSHTAQAGPVTAVQPITSPLGQIIEVLPQTAICWLEVAPGRRVTIEVDMTHREVRFAPLQRDTSLDGAFETMCRQFEDWRGRAHADNSDQK
jgi:hypothetical protein